VILFISQINSFWVHCVSIAEIGCPLAIRHGLSEDGCGVLTDILGCLIYHRFPVSDVAISFFGDHSTESAQETLFKITFKELVDIRTRL